MKTQTNKRTAPTQGYFYHKDQVPEIVHNQFMQMFDLVIAVERAAEGDFAGAYRMIDDAIGYIERGSQAYPGMYLSDKCQEQANRTRQAISKLEKTTQTQMEQE
jgi:hypothetical protein